MVYPGQGIRDTSEFLHWKLKRGIGLKNAVRRFLNKDIQMDTHGAAEDAIANMELYLNLKDEWESSDDPFIHTLTTVSTLKDDQNTQKIESNAHKNPISELQYWLQARKAPLPIYSAVETNVAAYCKVGESITMGFGANFNASKREAAVKMLGMIHQSKQYCGVRIYGQYCRNTAKTYAFLFWSYKDNMAKYPNGLFSKIIYNSLLFRKNISDEQHFLGKIIVFRKITRNFFIISTVI
jgi:hypothetical protein